MAQPGSRTSRIPYLRMRIRQVYTQPSSLASCAASLFCRWEYLLVGVTTWALRVLPVAGPSSPFSVLVKIPSDWAPQIVWQPLWCEIRVAAPTKDPWYGRDGLTPLGFSIPPGEISGLRNLSSWSCTDWGRGGAIRVQLLILYAEQLDRSWSAVGYFHLTPRSRIPSVIFCSWTVVVLGRGSEVRPDLLPSWWHPAPTLGDL